MITIQQVFDTAIHMMDEQNEASGVTKTQDTMPYLVRTISILNAIMPSLFPYSDTYPQEAVSGRRPVCPMLQVTDYRDPDFSQQIPLDDSLAIGVLPYALAAHLLAGENDELAAFFNNKYMMAFGDLREKVPASFERIETPYGLF